MIYIYQSNIENWGVALRKEWMYMIEQSMKRVGDNQV